MDSELPRPSAEELAHSERLAGRIRRQIEVAGGVLPFDRFMESALYAPGLGYYVAGSRKFGSDGDFVTAPEISPLFGQCLARQTVQVLDSLGGGDVLEFGAGSGILAAELLAEMEALGHLPRRYSILELSPDLQQRQRETLARRVPDLLPRVEWLRDLPQEFCGLVLANEVLDAMPVQRFRVGAQGFEEEFVAWREDGFSPVFGPVTSPHLAPALGRLRQQGLELSAGYGSEINLRAAAWIQALAQSLGRAAVLLIDYGFPRREYYHPQRSMGTLLCHYRHRVHANPYILPGLQDITAHVDFTAIAEAACAAGFRLAGYTTQAHFLIGCGLDGLFARSDPEDLVRHLGLVQEVKKLTLPTEMGESFKVLGLLWDLQIAAMGFAPLDLQDRLCLERASP